MSHISHITKVGKIVRKLRKWGFIVHLTGNGSTYPRNTKEYEHGDFEFGRARRTSGVGQSHF